MANGKQTVGVIFGSRSVEHDVSIVSANQVMRALNPAKYEVVPIYIGRNGRWFTGAPLRDLKTYENSDIAAVTGVSETLLSPNTAYPGLITPPISGRFGKSSFIPLDVVFPVVHGSHGEDGTLQGLFELADLPFVGAGILASAIANDKAMTKHILQAHDLPIVDAYHVIQRQEWLSQRETIISSLSASVGFPAFVKPATLGSSIGVAKAEDAEQVALHIDIALNLDRRVLVEKAIVGEDIQEINCAVMGNGDLKPSVLEQPISYEQFLTYDEKYMRGGKGMKGQERVIPAPIDDDFTEKIQAAAVDAFRAIHGTGIARLDFLVDVAQRQFWINEINTIPGSLSFYLWEPSGISASALCDELIRLALEVHQEKRRNTYNYKSQVVQFAASRGAKGSKVKSS